MSNVSNPKFSYYNSSDKSLGIKLVYPDGDKTVDLTTRKEMIQRTSFRIICSEASTKPEIHYYASQKNTEDGILYLDYQFNVRTNLVCSSMPEGPSNPLPAIIFFLLILLIFVCVCCCGAAVALCHCIVICSVVGTIIIVIVMVVRRKSSSYKPIN